MSNPKHDPSVLGFVRVSVPGFFSDLDTIRQVVADQGRQAGLTDDQTAQLEMAVDEACTNIIEHSYGGEPSKTNKNKQELTLQFIRHKDRLVVEIFDQGNGFDFLKHNEITPEKWLSDQRERGLGMFIITHFVDDVAYERGTTAGNYLRLTKRF